MVVIDATTLLLFFRPDTPVSIGPDGHKVDRAKERIEYLISTLEKQKTKIIIPTPALSEALVRTDPSVSDEIIKTLQRFETFRIEPFDTLASIEVAAMSREALKRGNKRGNSSSPWAKVKYDRQIVAIAKVHAATAIYSDDGDIAILGRQAGLKVISLAELPLPQQPAQLSFLDPAKETPQSVAKNYDT